jgi:hypothetical protein
VRFPRSLSSAHGAITAARSPRRSLKKGARGGNMVSPAGASRRRASSCAHPRSGCARVTAGGTSMRPRPTRPAIWIPGRRATVVVGEKDTGGLLGPGFRLDRPIDDPAQVHDGDLHDHHQPDQLPHGGRSLAPVESGSQPATAASSLPLRSSRPRTSYCVSSKVALEAPRSTPRLLAIRTGRPPATSYISMYEP